MDVADEIWDSSNMGYRQLKHGIPLDPSISLCILDFKNILGRYGQLYIYIHTETTEVSDYDQLEFLHTTPVSDFRVEHLNPILLRVSVYLVANYPRLVSGLVHPSYKWDK